MKRTLRHRLGVLALVFIASIALSTVAATASVEMAAGPQQVVSNQPLDQCDTQAKSALDAVLQNAYGANNIFMAYGTRGGRPSDAAAVHCYPLDNGYFVTFTCAVEQPAPYHASDLCTKLATAFSNGAPSSAASAAPSGGPSPAPSASPRRAP